MTKGFIAGMTDYSHQSFEDIINDLNEEIKAIDSNVDIINKYLKEVQESGFWEKSVPYVFKNIISYSLKHYKTSKSEFKDIIKDTQFEIKEHHCKRLEKIAETASTINIKIGEVWHQQYNEKYKDYNDSDFKKVEEICYLTRDIAVNLLDISNIAERLKDFIGKSNINMTHKNNPWISGSFYLIAFIIVISGLAALSKTVEWFYFPIILIGGILLFGIIGAFQLKNDGLLKDKSFIILITETYKRLPLLKNLRK